MFTMSWKKGGRTDWGHVGLYFVMCVLFICSFVVFCVFFLFFSAVICVCLLVEIFICLSFWDLLLDFILGTLFQFPSVPCAIPHLYPQSASRCLSQSGCHSHLSSASAQPSCLQHLVSRAAFSQSPSISRLAAHYFGFLL